MKKLIILVIVLVILLLIYQQKDNSNKQKTTVEQSLLISDNSVKENDLHYKVKDNPTKKTPPVDEFMQLTLQEKETLFSRCVGYSDSNSNRNLSERVEILDVEKAINDYSEHYKNGTGKDLTKKQLNVLKLMYARCNILFGNESNIFKEMTPDTSNFIEEIKTLEEEKGKEYAKEFAAKYLLDFDEKLRLDAIAYLMDNQDWIEQVNKDLGFKGLELNESREYFNEAMSAIECEQGFRNCHANSEMMNQICLSIPNACGLDFYAFQRMMVSEYDLGIIERYKEYLYGLNP